MSEHDLVPVRLDSARRAVAAAGDDFERFRDAEYADLAAAERLTAVGTGPDG